MKKIITLCLAFIMLAWATSNAQSFTVYSHGEPIADGATIDVKGELTETKYEDGDYSIVFRDCKWDPELVVKAESGVKGTVTLAPEGKGWQICWPESCKTVAAGKTLDVEGVFDSTGSNLQIHCEFSAYDEELDLPDTNSAKVIITAGDEKVTITLVNDKPSARVEGLVDGSAVATIYYNLQGQKIENPSNGIFIKVAGGKSSKVVMK